MNAKEIEEEIRRTPEIEDRKPGDMKKDIAAFKEGQNVVRAKIDKIIKKEGFDKMDYDEVVKIVTEDLFKIRYPNTASKILQVLQQTETSKKERPSCGNCVHGCKFVKTCKFHEAL